MAGLFGSIDSMLKELVEDEGAQDGESEVEGEGDGGAKALPNGDHKSDAAKPPGRAAGDQQPQPAQNPQHPKPVANGGANQADVSRDKLHNAARALADAVPHAQAITDEMTPRQLVERIALLTAKLTHGHGLGHDNGAGANVDDLQQQVHRLQEETTRLREENALLRQGSSAGGDQGQGEGAQGREAALQRQLEDALAKLRAESALVDSLTELVRDFQQEQTSALESLKLTMEQECPDGTPESVQNEVLAQVAQRAEQAQHELEDARREVQAKQTQVDAAREQCARLQGEVSRLQAATAKLKDRTLIDSQLVTSLMVTYITHADQRSDVLTVMSGILAWDDDTKRKVGLIGKSGWGWLFGGQEEESEGNIADMWVSFLLKEAEGNRDELAQGEGEGEGGEGEGEGEGDQHGAHAEEEEVA